MVHIVYGKKGAFGIFTPARSTRQAINAYLDGFLVEQNVRIRDKPIKFQTHTDRSNELGNPVVEWGDIEKSLGNFNLKTGQGKDPPSRSCWSCRTKWNWKIHYDQNLGGEHEYDEGWVTAGASISYKPQHIDTDMDCTVQTWLDAEVGPKWRSGEYNVNVIRSWSR